MLKKIW